MSVQDDSRRVSRKITTIYQRRKQAVYALCLSYAGRALNYFRQNQDSGAYWENRTFQARDRVFSDAQIEGDIISWFLAHGVDYGVYLELANNRKNEALRPTIVRFFDDFKRDLESLYGAH